LAQRIGAHVSRQREQEGGEFGCGLIPHSPLVKPPESLLRQILRVCARSAHKAEKVQKTSLMPFDNIGKGFDIAFSCSAHSFSIEGGGIEHARPYNFLLDKSLRTYKPKSKKKRFFYGPFGKGFHTILTECHQEPRQKN
ncbi:MAG: hypothetical protein N3A66_07465, partial [Planctomycetota bacterium]|nr:hypothetical protein [Planctomycetota bacterium]